MSVAASIGTAVATELATMLYRDATCLNQSCSEAETHLERSISAGRRVVCLRDTPSARHCSWTRTDVTSHGAPGRSVRVAH